METDKAKGKLKQAAGALTGDKDLKRDGKIDEKAGQAKQAVGRAKNKLSDTVHKARDEKKQSRHSDDDNWGSLQLPQLPRRPKFCDASPARARLVGRQRATRRPAAEHGAGRVRSRRCW